MHSFISAVLTAGVKTTEIKLNIGDELENRPSPYRRHRKNHPDYKINILHNPTFVKDCKTYIELPYNRVVHNTRSRMARSIVVIWLYCNVRHLSSHRTLKMAMWIG
jgi:hypothetical protein